MGKMKRKPVINEKSDSEDSENDSMIENDTSENEDSEKDSMIENGTSESEDSESENESASLSSDEENQDSGHSELQPEASRKRKQSTTTLESANAKKVKEDRKLYKQPTVEEINQLRETENLYHSNLFRLQIQEMLNEVRVKEKYKSFARSWLEEFNTFLSMQKSMPEKVVGTNAFFLTKKKIIKPVNLRKLYSKNFHFQFIAPQEKAFLIGSAETDTWIGDKLIADVCVPMPSKCFQKEDYLNLIYDQKRALYLAYIANQMLKKKFHATDLKFNFTHNNPYKPVLEVVPDGKIGKKLTFRIYVSGDEKSFKLNRFVPWNSNIRDSLFRKKKENDEDEIPLATPNYNATVLYDLTQKANQACINQTVGQQKNLKDGLILLKIWLRQRKLDVGFCGFSNHLMALLVVYLFKQRKIHASMSSYQVARNVWNYLATSTWNLPEKGISLSTNYGLPNQPTLEQFHTYYEIVFVDSTGYLNLCSNLSLEVYLAIKYESQRALELLNNTKVNSFQSLFMANIPIYTRFDHFLKISNGSVIVRVLKEFGQKADRYSFAGHNYPQIAKMICKIIRKGLGDRIHYMLPIEGSFEPWSIKKESPKPNKYVNIGFVLNRETACDILDKGPQANEPSSEEFRKFWGEKSQLRRFQDGSITEACVWAPATATPIVKRLVVKEIVKYLLDYHLKIKSRECQYFANEFDLAYSLDKLFYVFEMGREDAENTSLKVIQKFDDIAKKLRSCDDLPLDITSVQGISSVFRYCDPVPTLSNASHYKEDDKLVFQGYKVCRGVIQLGLSGKWPNDLGALRRLKTAFHIQIARTLREKFKLITRGDISGVYILNDGYLFKVEIFHQKEVALMKKTISVRGAVQYVDTVESMEFERKLDVLPKVTSALHGLYQRCTSFGPTVMIAKRWLNSQLIDSYLWPEECTELLVASQFLKPGSCPNPVQPQTGFFRFLDLLANFDFKNELVVLNFNDEITHDEIVELEAKFAAERDSYPPLAIITSFDTKKDCIWSKQSPSPHILARVILLARFALRQIDIAFSTQRILLANELFIASLDGYDVLITLNPNLVRSCHAHNFEPLPIAGKRLDVTVPAADFDPVQKGLQELRDGFSEFAVFFYNPCGGKHIGVIWKPECFTEREFKIGNVNGCFVEGNGVVKCNVTQLINDIKITLKGLFANVEDLRANRIKAQ